MPISLSSPISEPSPIVDQVVGRQRLLLESRDKLKWALANFVAAALLFIESENHFVLRRSSSW
jgi:hypothetical protein